LPIYFIGLPLPAQAGNNFALIFALDRWTGIPVILNPSFREE
jgi:hypothetical protein